jgi:uncharacterized protein (DUF1499 family)
VSWSRTELVKEEGVYLHYEVTSRLDRFVDDVEIVFDDASKTTHFRSAARMGYYDLVSTGGNGEGSKAAGGGNSNHGDLSVMQCRLNT